ncbi:MAG: hypothetical protein ACFFAO_04935 [Candidatus Hermodarchaeota archaeon]
MEQYIKEKLKEKYLLTFYGKDGNHYGFRFGIPSDAKNLIEIFKDVYGWKYLYPKVYDVKLFQKSIEKKDQEWFIVELIKTGELVGTGVMENKNELSVYAGKTAIKKNNQGIGISKVLGTQSVFIFLSRPEMKNIIRLDTDVRARNIKVQKFAEKIRCIPYGFIPNYNNYGDKRNFDISRGHPFSSGEKESVIMYVSPIKNFWKKRHRNIILLNIDDIIYFYEYVKSFNRNMRKDILTLYNKSIFISEEFKIKEDYYKSVVLIEGYLHEKTLIKLLKKYSKWNVIEWRIPTSRKGLYSQKIGLKHGFKIVGYDPGSYSKNNLIRDTLVYCNFPTGIDFNQFEGLDLVKKNEDMVNKIINSVKEFKK